MAELDGRRVLVSVGGSVAAFKACEVVTSLRKAGADTRVAMTEAATRFVTVALLRALSGRRVAADMWDADGAEIEHGMSHLDLAAWAELHVVVAAPADLIARLALGLAGDVVTATALASRAPLLVAPAMEGAMWEHPATQQNAATLRERGAEIIGPVHGRLASGEVDTGRMSDAADIVAAVTRRLA